MLEIIGIGAAASTATLIVTKYLSSEPSGCNGHHWGEVRRIDEEGVSSHQRDLAGVEEKCVDNPTNALHTKILLDSVRLYTTGIKKCKDCGEYTTTEVRIGSIDVDEFEES
jgi:hypothetical protein